MERGESWGVAKSLGGMGGGESQEESHWGVGKSWREKSWEGGELWDLGVGESHGE